MSIALAPATTLRTPSAKMACARYGRGAGSVTDHVAGLFGGLAQHARAKILLRILEVEFLGNRHAVVADDRRAPFFLDQHGFGPRAQGHAHGIGQLRRAAQNLLTGGGAEEDLLVCHGGSLPWKGSRRTLSFENQLSNRLDSSLMHINMREWGRE